MSQTTSTISIICAVKDGLDLLRETTESVLAQTDRDWEWIVIDDGSTEPVGAYLSGLSDPRIRILRNDLNQGQTKSLNRGIREAQGEWIVRIDGDDLCTPDRIARLRQAIQENPGASLIFSDYDVIGPRGEPVSLVRYQNPVRPSFYRYLETRNNPICHSTVAFRKKSATSELNLYREDLNNTEDWDLWRRLLAAHGPRFAHIPHVLLHYRLVPTAKCGVNSAAQREELRALRQGTAPASDSRGEAKEDRRAFFEYRNLYYRFIGTDAESAGWAPQDFAAIRQALGVAAVRKQSLLYFAGKPIRSLLKPIVFGDFYR